jgi:hypothetical protein
VRPGRVTPGMLTSAAGSRVSWPPGNVTQPPGLAAYWKTGRRQWKSMAVALAVGVALGTEAEGLGLATLGRGEADGWNGVQPVKIKRQTPRPARSLLSAFTLRITVTGLPWFRSSSVLAMGRGRSRQPQLNPPPPCGEPLK